MSKRYTFAALATGMTLIATPAFADGYPDRPVQKGPPPLEAHAPAPDCELIGGEDWYCPPRHTTTRRYVDESKTRHYVNRYTTGGICCTPSAPPPQRVAYQPRTERGLSIDTGGFGGGVGAGVNGNFYGGGGGFAYASASASSSAYASAAARIAFSASFRGGGGGGGCPGRCGGGGS